MSDGLILAVSAVTPGQSGAVGAAGSETIDALTILAGMAAPAVAAPAPSPEPAPRAENAPVQALLAFEPNVGQTDAQVQFLARGAGYTLFLTSTGSVLNMQTGASAEENTTIGMELTGGNAAAVATGEEPLPGTVNYYVGNDPSQWRSGIATYGRVTYQDVYPGIDLTYYGTPRGDLEYDFVVAPGADAGAIRLTYSGAERVEVDAGGDLLLHLGGQVIRQHAPFTYQEVAGARQEVASRYELLGPNQVGFTVGAHDGALPVVIDPVMLFFSTYLGGNGTDIGRDVAADPYTGLVAMTGLTTSTNFPTLNPLQSMRRGPADAFVVLYNSVNNQRVYATYLGGTGSDEGLAVAIDSYFGFGVVWVTGLTTSTNFVTTPGALQPTYGGGGSDAFVTALFVNGTLAASTYLGGSAADEGAGISMDSNYAVYVTGNTSSTNFLTRPGALQPTLGGGVDAFLTRLDYPLSTSDLSTYLGGLRDDFGFGVSVSAAFEIFVVGSTTSANFPTAGAVQPTLRGAQDAFVLEFGSGGILGFSTFFGGTDEDMALDVVADYYYGFSVCWVSGATSSSDFPLVNPSQAAYGGGLTDGFVAQFAGTGEVGYSTFLGGLEEDAATATGLDANLFQYVAGTTDSRDFPVLNASQSTYGGGDDDAFVTKLGYFGERLYSTYHGGSLDDQGLGLSVDQVGATYMVGITDSTNFPRRNPFQMNYGGGVYDAFLSKFIEV